MYQSSGKEKENGCFLFPSPTKREIGLFHVLVVQRRLRNVQKSVMHVQSCYFANLNLFGFCRSHCRLRRRCLSSLLYFSKESRGTCWFNYFKMPRLFEGGAFSIESNRILCFSIFERAQRCLFLSDLNWRRCSFEIRFG